MRITDESDAEPAVEQGLRARAKKDRLARIVEAANSLMLEKDFQDITTRDLAQRAGIGEATLFRYIRSKTEILTIVYGHRMDAVLDEIERADAEHVAGRAAITGDDAVARILAVYHRRCDFYLIDPNNAALYLREGFDAGGNVSARHVAQGDRTVRQVASILDEGQRAGVVLAAIDPRLVAQNCHATYMHEIDRTPVRGFDPSTIWDRLRPRLATQIVPLVLDEDVDLSPLQQTPVP